MRLARIPEDAGPMVADKLPTLLLVQNRSFASSMEDLVDRQILPERGLIGDSGGLCADRTPGQRTVAHSEALQWETPWLARETRTPAAPRFRLDGPALSPG